MRGEMAIGSASASDSTLEIFGNANMDETIDDLDIAYVEGIIKGTNEATNMSDSDYDGKVDENDINQIKMIIAGEEKAITLVDSAEKIVTVKKPLGKLVVLLGPILEPMRSIKVDEDKIVGIGTYMKEDNVFYPEFNGSQGLGSVSSPDYEAILEIHPDTVWLYASVGSSSSYDEIQNKLAKIDPSITILRIDGYRPSNHVDEIRKMGYILGKRNESEEFIDFYSGVMDKIKGRLEKLSDDDKPKVYFEASPETDPYKTCGEGSGYHEKIVLAG